LGGSQAETHRFSNKVRTTPFENLKKNLKAENWEGFSALGIQVIGIGLGFRASHFRFRV
jgi:hypothetical protein